jgi:transcriptional regulator with XRE-family HTH domain
MATIRARDAVELGRGVRAARRERGWSHAQLATHARVGRQWLVEFEAGGKPSAPLDMVIRLLAALETDAHLRPARRPTTITPLGITASDIITAHTHTPQPPGPDPAPAGQVRKAS